MATNSIVGGLFGIDPEQYQMAQQARQENQALQFAQLDPMQQAQYGMFRGGQQAVNAGAGMLGVQDPMLQKATLLKEIASRNNYQTPEGLMKMAKELSQYGLNEQAQMAITQAQKMQESQATVYSKTREHLSTMGKLQSERDRLLAMNPNDPRIAEYNKAIAAEGTSRTPSISVDAKMFDFGAGRRDSFFKEIAPIITQGSAINQSLSLINQGTPFAQAALENTVVSAFGGDKQKSRQEIKNLMNTGDLPTRVVNSLGKFLEGTISEKSTEDQKNVLEALQGNLKRTYNAKRETIIKASSKVPELRGQEEFYAPTWESTVSGGGASMGKKAYTQGETFNLKGVGPVKVLEVDSTGKPTKVQNSKGEIGTPQ